MIKGVQNFKIINNIFIERKYEKMIQRIIYCTIFSVIALFISNANAVQLKHLNDLYPSKFNISGTLQTILTKSEIEQLDENIDINRFRLNINGKLNENVSFFTEFEIGGNRSSDTLWAAKPDTRMKILDNNAVTSNNNGDIYEQYIPNETSIAGGARYAQKDMGADSRLVQAYVDLKYIKKITLRIGQMARGSGYELNTPVNKLETINYSTNTGQFGKFVRGFQLKMAPFKFMKVGIGIDDSVGGITGGTNEPKAKLSPGAKIVFIPWKKHFSIKLCARHVSETKNMPDGNAGVAGTVFKYKGFNFQGEMYYLHVNPVNTGTKKGLKGNICSWYLHASYIIPKTKIQLVSRYNFFEKRMRSIKTDILKAPANYYMEIITAGINWSFSPYSRLQVMYDVVDGDNNDSLDFQLELSF